MTLHSFCRCWGIVILAGVATATAALALDISTVPVGDAGNTADTRAPHFGAVSYRYNISKYDVTNSEYAQFLNAKAASGDPFGLYNTNMAAGTQGGITRSGTSTFTYTVNAGYADKPVDYVCWYDAIRFTNWLTNGQGSGDTESGTYAIAGGGLNSGTFTAPSSAQRAAWDATSSKHWLLPNEDEWYKAAYFKGGSTSAGYWLYPFQSDSVPTAEAPIGGSNSANYNNAVGGLTTVGAYIGSKSHYGAFDMGGDVLQWTETIAGSGRALRGGDWEDDAFGLSATVESSLSATAELNFVGFRVAQVPEPGSFMLLGLGALGLLLWGRRRHGK